MPALSRHDGRHPRDSAKAVDTATSWTYSAGETKIADKLREGLDAAGVTVDESAGTPTVRAASPG